MKLLIQWAVTSGALILIVLAARYLFRDKLSARWRYALWGVVLLRLLVPFQVELPAKTSDALPVLASNLAQDVTPRLDDTLLYAIPTKDQPDQPSGEVPEFQYARNRIPGHNWGYYSGGLVYDGERVTRYAFMMTALEVLVYTWIAGTALISLALLASNLRFYRRLKKRRKPLEGVDAPVPVYVAEGLPSPCLFGVFRPAVYVTPEAAENPDALRHVLAHELTHYAHKDHIWSLLRCLALALHWYNPLVWLAVVLSKRDGELACDEGAVARLGEGERIPYGRTLVDMVAARSARPVDLLSCSTAMTGGKKSIQQRVARLVRHPETVKAALFAAVAVVALSVVFVFAERSSTPGNSDAIDAFLAQVKGAQSISVGNPSISSQLSPPAITDPEVLAQAKELLSAAKPVVRLEDGSLELLKDSLNSGAEPKPITQEELEGQFLIWGHRLNLCPTAEHDLDTADSYYLIPWNDYCLLTQWYPEREENKHEVVAGFPGDTVSRLKALARGENAEITSSDLDRFLAQVEYAVAIYYHDPSPFHSDEVFEPIVDYDLLPSAKAKLADMIPIGQAGGPVPDPKGAKNAPQVTICPTSDRAQTYRLLLEDGYTYLLPMEEDTILARSTERYDLADFIKSLSRTEYGRRLRGEAPQPVRFLTQVEAAGSIRYFPPSYSSTFYPDPITDGKLLAQARDALSTFVLLSDNDPQPDLSPREAIHEHRVTLTFEDGQMEYGLLWQNDRTYLFPGSVWRQSLDLKEEEGENTQLLGVSGTCISDVNVIALLSDLARQQTELNRDPSLPKSMTQEELKRYDAAFLRKAGVTQLQGRPDSMEGVTFHAGYTTPEQIQLWYWGDETHNSVWVLALSKDGDTLLADQPIEVFNAVQNAAEEASYEQLGPGAFAAFLRPEEVVSVTAGNYFPGQAVTLDIQTLKDQLVRALYHQRSAEYAEEKYGRYVLTLCVEKDVGYYLHDGGRDGLILSAGSEPDIVCLRHRILASPDGPMTRYVYSPELYRTIRNLFD